MFSIPEMVEILSYDVASLFKRSGDWPARQIEDTIKGVAKLLKDTEGSL